MSNKLKNISNPFSTGGGGIIFETQVQASFFVLMLTKSHSPCFSNKLIEKLVFQGKVEGYETDDLIVELIDCETNTKHKLLAQIKHSIAITENKRFQEVIDAAWKDFNSPKFNNGQDVIALITGPLTKIDTDHVRPILEKARDNASEKDFFLRMKTAKYVGKQERKKLSVLRECVNSANGKTVSNEELFQFLQHLHLLGYDLDIKTGVLLALFHSLIGKLSEQDVKSVWGRIVSETQSLNKNGGTVTNDSVSTEIRDLFNKKLTKEIPESLIEDSSIKPKNEELSDTQKIAVVIASLVGEFDENNTNDEDIIKGLTDGI